MLKVKPTFNKTNKEVEKLKEKINTLEKRMDSNELHIRKLSDMIKQLEDSVYDV